MDHSLAIRKDPERVWTYRKRTVAEEIGESTSSYEFPEEKTASVCRELLRILEAAFGICAVMLMGTGSLWIGMIIMTAGLELSCRYIEKSVKN